MQPALRSVNYEVVSSGGATQSAALVTADFSGADERSRLIVTVQLSSLGKDMKAGYRQGFGAGLDNLAGAGAALREWSTLAREHSSKERTPA